MAGGSDWVVVLSTFNQADVALAKHMLEREDIVYFVQGENFNLLHPMVSPTRFAVRQEQAQTATELLAGLDSDPSCDTEEERAEQPTEGTFKSVRVSIILTVLLGPLGMFYSTVGGATIMTLTALVVGPAIGYGVLVMWPVCIVWGVFATRSYNDRQGRMGRTSPGVTVDERLFASRQKK